MSDDIEAEAIELATAQSPLTNMQVAELLAEVERLKADAYERMGGTAYWRVRAEEAEARAIAFAGQRDRLEVEVERLKGALGEITAMDPKGIRADDLGRAARIASAALDAKP